MGVVLQTSQDNVQLHSLGEKDRQTHKDGNKKINK